MTGGVPNNFINRQIRRQRCLCLTQHSIPRVHPRSLETHRKSRLPCSHGQFCSGQSMAPLTKHCIRVRDRGQKMTESKMHVYSHSFDDELGIWDSNVGDDSRLKFQTKCLSEGRNVANHLVRDGHAMQRRIIGRMAGSKTQYTFDMMNHECVERVTSPPG